MTVPLLPAKVSRTDPVGPGALKTARTAVPSAHRYAASVAEAELAVPTNIRHAKISFTYWRSEERVCVIIEAFMNSLISEFAAKRRSSQTNAAWLTEINLGRLPCTGSHAVEDLQIAAGAKRDDDAIGRQIHLLQLGRGEMALHAEAILQRPR